MTAIQMIDEGEDGYRAGACNIGPAEIRRRRATGIVGLVATGALGLGLVAIGAPSSTRLLVALPATVAAFGFLQARSRFCVGFALAGVRNFGPLGAVSRVDDAAAHRADLIAAMKLGAASLAIGMAVGVAFTLIPG